jgi:tRNA threonylcarbamoyladenosine biosynthesis protein TsaB
MTAVGIETSGRYGSVAAVRDDVCLAQRALSRTGRRHARTLVTELQELLNSAEISPERLDVVAVSIGPGSFTGLRVGLVCAKTMAYATGATLIAVDTFEAVSRNAPADVDHQFVIGDAQRGELFVGRYQRTLDGGWERVGEIQIVPLETWRDQLPGDVLVSGPGLEVYQAELSGYARLLDTECWTPFASQVARIGLERALAGTSDDPFSIVPRYLRRSGAEEKLDSRSDGRTP